MNLRTNSTFKSKIRMITTAINCEVEEYVNLSNNDWTWNWELIHKRQSKINELLGFLSYRNTNFNVLLFYTNIVDVPKKPGDLNNFTEDQILNYIDMFGMSLIFRIPSTIKVDQKHKKLCKLCTKLKAKIWFFEKELLICNDCVNKKYKPTTFIINKRPGLTNIVTGLIETKIDIVVLIGNKLCYFYHSTFDIKKFNYKTMLFEPITTSQECICTRCLRHRRFNNSVCLVCFNYSYELTFRFVVEFWLTMDFGFDIMCNIFEKLLHLMGYYDVNFTNIYNNITPKKLIKNE